MKNNKFNLINGVEDVSRRELNVKHFNLGAGRHQAVLFDEPVHFINDKGEMTEIDNNLVADTVDGRKVLRNVSNPMKVEFPVNAGDGDLVRITTKDRTLSWSFSGRVNPVESKNVDGKSLLRRELISRIPEMKARLIDVDIREKKVMSTRALAQAVAKTVEIENPDAFIEVMAAEKPEMLSLEKLDSGLRTPVEQRLSRIEKQSEVMYSDILPGISVRYTITDGGVKEDIIVNNEAAQKNVAIRLPLEYNYVINEDQSVSVMDGDDVAFTFNPPVVYDADGNEDVAAVQLQHLENCILFSYDIAPDFLAKAAYPITIDPVVKTGYKDESAVTDCFIKSSNKSAVETQDTILRCGYDGGTEYIPLIRFNKLVKLSAADTMISAHLKLTAKYRQDDTYLACHEIKEMWYETGTNHVSWNKLRLDSTNPAIDPTIIAYISKVGVYDQYFDITDLCRRWYHLDENGNQQNFGVAIRYARGVAVEDQHIHWKATNGHTSDNPRLVVNYISHAGVEDWWQYETMSAGRAGTANVDLYNGNLVFSHPDVSSSGSLMPVSVTHHYNSCLSNINSYYCGNGWRTSMQQSLHIEKLNGNTYYVWTDGDGTEHFFEKQSSTKYTDCEGMKLTLTLHDNGRAKITAKDNSALVFEKPVAPSSGSVGAKKALMMMRDPINNANNAEGSCITLSYANGGYTNSKITEITDGAGRKTLYSYNSEGLLSRITAPDGTYVAFTYSGTNLVNVTYSDSTTDAPKKTVYTYSGNLLTSAKNYDNIKINIVYGEPDVINPDTATDPDNHDELSRRVSSMEMVSGTKYGEKLCFEYLQNTTKVTSVKDAASDAGKTITYQFNDAGNVTCMFDELGYAQATTYSSTIPNTAEQSSRLQRAVMNYCPSIDFSSGWINASGTGVTTDSNNRCLNMPSAKIASSGTYVCDVPNLAKRNDGGTGNQVYTFSAYIKRTGTVTGSAYIRLGINGTYYNSRTITTETSGVSEGPGAEGWDRVYISRSIPPEATVQLVIKATGAAWFACPQLETGYIPNPVNLLVNGDFSGTVSATPVSGTARLYPKSWTALSGITNVIENGLVTEEHGMPPILTGNALRMLSVPNKTSVAFQQTINVKGAKGDTYIMGGWVNAHSVAAIPTETSRKCAPCIAYRFVNGSANGDWKYLEFSREWIGWQFGCWPVVATGAYTKIEYTINYARNAQTGMFSNVFMYREQFGESFAYDSDKNVTSVQNLANTKSKMEYDDAHNLTSYIQPGAADTEKYTFNYGSTTALRKRHLLLQSKTPQGVTQKYEYDDRGNTTLAKTVNGTTQVIGAKTTYTANSGETALAEGVNQNYVRRSYDARGNAVLKTMDPTKYRLKSIKDPSGQTVNYSYDSMNRVTAVTATANSKTYRNRYTYSNDRIASVRHNTTSDTAVDVVYTFGYDVLGRKTTVKVGNGTASSNQTLSTNTYSSNRSGLLTKVAYGNGGQVRYYYDAFDRLSSVRYDDDTSARYAYKYGANGAVGMVIDYNLGQTKQVEYDLAERPCQATIFKTSNKAILYRTTLNYDARSRLEKFSEQTPGGNHTTAYTYDKDNRTTKVTFDGTPKIEYTYDALGRIQTRKATNGAAYTTNYGFVPGNTTMYGTGATTPLVNSITQGSGANAMNFTYTYDNRGNILTEAYANKTRFYGYDAIGQLIRVNDPWDTTAGNTGTTWIYEYDRGGNIQSKSSYAFTTGTVSGTPTTVQYQYADTNWKDKLTGYDGKTLTYDAIGNVLNDGVWDYEWAAGRQLKRMEYNGSSLDFKYNSDGLRVQKLFTPGDWYAETTNYTYHGKLLTHMTVDYVDFDTEQAKQDVLHFFYDAQSRPAMVKYNGTMYTYVHNLQGDIVAILNSAGTKVVEYKYDAWGNRLSVTGTMAATLGRRNPFRYRGYVYDEETWLYYLRSRYYNPEMGRFINADVKLYISTSNRCNNLYIYCDNLPSGLIDKYGLEGIWCAGDFGGYNGFAEAYYNRIYNEEIVPKLRKAAREKYNENTVHVYIKGEEDEIEGMINAFFYRNDDGNVNIHIVESREIEDTFEMGAIIDVISKHPLFSNKYGSKSHMIAQWIAHNETYKMSKGNFIQKFFVGLISRTNVSSAANSAKELDLRENGNFRKLQSFVYSLIEPFIADKY